MRSISWTKLCGRMIFNPGARTFSSPHQIRLSTRLSGLSPFPGELKPRKNGAPNGFSLKKPFPARFAKPSFSTLESLSHSILKAGKPSNPYRRHSPLHAVGGINDRMPVVPTQTRRVRAEPERIRYSISAPSSRNNLALVSNPSPAPYPCSLWSAPTTR